MASKTAGSGTPIKPKKPAKKALPVIVDEMGVGPGFYQAQTAIALAGEPINPFPVRTRDKVAIVGFAEGHRALTPFDDPSFEIWGLNRLWTVLPGRYDRWFEIHDVRKFYENDPQHREWMRQFKGPIYLRPQDMGAYDIPQGVPYPIEPILQEFPRYFTNSISYMMALAIVMGFREMHLYGVDMAQDGIFVTGSEYRSQRPSCELFLGIAIGRGMSIFLPDGSDLLKSSFMYGLEDGSAIMGKRLSRMQELNRRKDGIRQALEQLKQQKMIQSEQMHAQELALVAQINQLDGALQETVYEQTNLSPPPEVPPAQQVQLTQQ